MNNETDSLLNALRKVRRIMREFTMEIIQHSELTLPQLTVVAILEESGELPVSSIAAQAGLANSTISGIIDRLEKKKLVKRHRPEDNRRTVYVRLVKGSEKYYYEYKSLRDRFISERLKHLDKDRIKRITDNLEILGEALAGKGDSSG